MSRVQFSGDNNVSKPVKRMRWATQRFPGQTGSRKRLSILNRAPKVSTSSIEEKQRNSKTDPHLSDDRPMPVNEESRIIYMNVPLPDEAKTEEGHNKQTFGRNKIRTSKYTPLSFIPKNLWLQFHNIANLYFLFIIILCVSRALDHPCPHIPISHVPYHTPPFLQLFRFSRYLELQTQDSTLCL